MTFCCLNLQVELGWKGYDSGGQDTCSAEAYQFTKSTVWSFSNIQLSPVLADSVEHILNIRTHWSRTGLGYNPVGIVIEIEMLVLFWLQSYDQLESFPGWRVEGLIDNFYSTIR